MILVNQRPVNGVDLSHWNDDPPEEAFYGYSYLEMLGHKATHIFDDDCVDGVDPKFESRRDFADRMNVRWRPFYMWIMPATVAPPAVQVDLLIQTVGELRVGESVYLDWEEEGVTRTTIEDCISLLKVEYPDRWFLYANDQPGDMFDWMTDNLFTTDIPVMHPNYNLERGLSEARKWHATIWQCGKGRPPHFTSDVPMDYVMRPEVMDELCGR